MFTMSAMNKYQLASFVVLLSVILVNGAPKLNNKSNLGIIGGHDTDIAQHPWLVSLQRNGNHKCGGVLISNQWVLTAGHCLYSDAFQANLTVRIGSTYYTKGGQLLAPKKIIIHEDLNYKTSLENDVGLIQFELPVSGLNIKPIALPSPNEDPSNEKYLNVTGWGYTGVNGNLSEVLQGVSIPRISQSQCQEDAKSVRITDKLFCAGEEEGGRGVCIYDSGSPAVYRNHVVGLVTFAAYCARPHHPGIFVQVNKYLPWIMKNMAAQM